MERRIAMDKKVCEMIERIKQLPDGTATTTARLLLDLGYPVKEWSEDMFKAHYELMEEAEKQGIDLDMSSHDGKFEGLPYNLDFVVKKNIADE